VADRAHPVPAQHRHCNLCGGDGRSCLDRRRTCEACRGKGHWNAEDIRLYHEAHPKLCKECCGEAHSDPDFRTQAEQDADWRKLMSKLKAVEKKAVESMLRGGRRG